MLVALPAPSLFPDRLRLSSGRAKDVRAPGKAASTPFALAVLAFSPPRVPIIDPLIALDAPFHAFIVGRVRFPLPIPSLIAPFPPIFEPMTRGPQVTLNLTARKTTWRVPLLSYKWLMRDWINQLHYGDNLEVLRGLCEGTSIQRVPDDSVDLIDPPFNSEVYALLNRVLQDVERSMSHLSRCLVEQSRSSARSMHPLTLAKRCFPSNRRRGTRLTAKEYDKGVRIEVAARRQGELYLRADSR